MTRKTKMAKPRKPSLYDIPSDEEMETLVAHYSDEDWQEVFQILGVEDRHDRRRLKREILYGLIRFHLPYLNPETAPMSVSDNRKELSQISKATRRLLEEMDELSDDGRQLLFNTNIPPENWQALVPENLSINRASWYFNSVGGILGHFAEWIEKVEVHHRGKRHHPVKSRRNRMVLDLAAIWRDCKGTLPTRAFSGTRASGDGTSDQFTRFCEIILRPIIDEPVTDGAIRQALESQTEGEAPESDGK